MIKTDNGYVSVGYEGNEELRRDMVNIFSAFIQYRKDNKVADDAIEKELCELIDQAFTKISSGHVKSVYFNEGKTND